jgi:hypothetical protein
LNTPDFSLDIVSTWALGKFVETGDAANEFAYRSHRSHLGDLLAEVIEIELPLGHRLLSCEWGACNQVGMRFDA